MLGISNFCRIPQVYWGVFLATIEHKAKKKGVSKTIETTKSLKNGHLYACSGCLNSVSHISCFPWEQKNIYAPCIYILNLIYMYQSLSIIHIFYESSFISVEHLWLICSRHYMKRASHGP